MQLMFMQGSSARRAEGRRIIAAAAAICALVLVTGCASSRAAPPAVQPPPAERAEPFELEITDEVNDGTTLAVQGTVKSRAEWEASGVILQLTGHDQDGVPLVEERRTLAQLIESGAERLRPGESVPFILSIPVQQLANYQLSLLWGREAISAAQPVEKGATGEVVMLRNLEVSRRWDSCTATSCPILLELDGEIFNGGSKAVDSIELGVRLVWMQDGATAEKADEAAPEEAIELRDLALLPGAARKIKLHFEEQAEPRIDSKLTPVLRIIAVESAAGKVKDAE